jgi:hypothetical protein
MLVDTSPKYSGEPTAEALANGLATLGRYGDNYMVHAAEGETVVPREVLDANPGLKENLFKQMTMMGIEDPNRYVVGNELNSINPITGQPEFFFKKVFRAIKKVVKKIAPIAAPIIGNMIAPGIGGIIASGLVTKLQGGSWGDALKSAALSYAGSALSAGIGSALQGTSVGTAFGLGAADAGSTFGSRFAEGLGRGLTSPFEAAGNLFSSGAANPLAQGIFGPRGTGTFFKSLSGTAFDAPGTFGGQAPGQQGFIDKVFPSYQNTAALQAANINPATGGFRTPPTAAPRGSVTTQPLGPTQDVINAENAKNFANLKVGQEYNPEAYTAARKLGFDQTASFSAASDPNEAAMLLANQKAVTTPGIQRAAPGQPDVGGTTLGTTPKESFFTRNLGPTAGPIAEKVVAGSIVPAALAGAAYFMSPEVETQAELMAQLDANNPRRKAYDEWQAIEDKNSPEALAKFEQWYGQPAYSASQLASSFGANPLSGITGNVAPVTGGVASIPTTYGGPIGPGMGLPFAAAGGGEIVGPGTGTSDSIPAMLSDGEFVMTAKAVRNAGNGNRDLGAARMYDMMNRFERGMA